LPKRPELHERIKGAYWAALDEATKPEDAERRLRQVVTTLEREYPSAADCLAEDLPALCAHLKYFPRLRKRFRSSNLLERSLEEVRRRTKVIGRLPGETSCLSLCWAMLDMVVRSMTGEEDLVMRNLRLANDDLGASVWRRRFPDVVLKRIVELSAAGVYRRDTRTCDTE
jgi:Transposase, Mutator family